MKEHMLQLCKMDLFNAERENKGESKKQIKTNKEHFFFFFIPSWFPCLDSNCQERSFTTLLINEPFSSERGTVRQGGTKKTDVTFFLFNHNTGRSAICTDCQNTVANVADKQNTTETRPPTLAVCLFVCLSGFVWLKYDNWRSSMCVGLYSALQTKYEGIIISLLWPLRAHAEEGSKKDTGVCVCMCVCLCVSVCLFVCVCVCVSWFEFSDQARLSFVCCTEGDHTSTYGWMCRRDVMLCVSVCTCVRGVCWWVVSG